MSNYKTQKIVNNTIVLYIRLLISMFITLYTTRVVLEVLGVSDFGIYNVVGGVVVMFSFLTGPLKTATQRYLNYEIGQGNNEKLYKVFSVSFFIYVGMSFVLLLSFMTLGYYFLIHYIVIPSDRLEASVWVYYFSIGAFVVTILSIPFEAVLNAHENMRVIAAIELFQSIAKLGLALIIPFVGYDKLKFYAFFLFLVSMLSTLFYGIYAKRKYAEVRFRIIRDKELYKELSAFAGWNLLGSFAGVLQYYGSNIMLNIFFGTIINAAYGVARQVSAAFSSFTGNYIRAVGPQITQSYSSGERDYMLKLVFYSSKFSYFLFLTLSLTFFIEIDWVLKMWIKVPPDYTSIFCRLVIIEALINTLSPSLMISAQASGKVKIYQSVVGGLLLLNLPLSYVFLRISFPPYCVLVVAVVISCMCLVARLLVLKKIIQFPVRIFMSRVVLRSFFVTILALIVPVIAASLVEENFLHFIYIGFISLLSCGITIYYIGMNKNERTFVMNNVKKVMCK